MAPVKVREFPRFPELDGIRGLAVLMVFCHHVTLFNADGPWNHAQSLLKRLCGPGHAGVDLFFVLSGFLITSILLRERGSPSYFADFYWKRTLRVLPLYGLVLLLLLALVPHSARYVLLAFFFLANFASALHVYLVTPFWSLAVEEQFYLLWPAIVRHRSTKEVSRFAIGVVGASFLLRIAFAAFHHYNYFLTFLHCDGLALGALLACRFRQSREENRSFESASGRLLAAMCIGLLTAIGAQFISAESWLASNFSNIELTGIALTCFGAIGLCVAYTDRPWLAVLRSPILTFFGLISYAFYVIHLFVIQAYDHFSPTPVAGNNAAYVIRLFVVFAISVGLSLVSRFAVELPALSLRSRVLSHREPPAETQLTLLGPSPNTHAEGLE